MVIKGRPPVPVQRYYYRLISSLCHHGQTNTLAPCHSRYAAKVSRYPGTHLHMQPCAELVAVGRSNCL